MAQEAWASAGVRPPGIGWTYWAGGLSTEEPEGAGRVRETTLALFCCGEPLLGGPPCQALALHPGKVLCQLCPGAVWQAEVQWSPPPMGLPQAVEASAFGPSGSFRTDCALLCDPSAGAPASPAQETGVSPWPEAPTEGWVGEAWSGNGHCTNLDK